MRHRTARGSGTIVLSDVAKRAGVSTATVSRVLNAPETVALDTRGQVERAIAALGYIPHGAARALASRHSRTVGAIVPTLDNAIFAASIDALQRTLSSAGYTLLIASSNYSPDEELRELRILLERAVEAVVLVGAEHDALLHRLLDAKRVPFVNTWVYERTSGAPCVGFDNARAAGEAAAYLVSLGHRRIAMVAGETAGNDRARARVEGVRATLEAAGIGLPQTHVVERPYDIVAGRDGLRTLLRLDPGPTAILCGNDVLAFGVLFEALAQGIGVPEALSIIGFDDLPLAAQLSPPLTTMRVPSGDLGRSAGRYLLARLEGRSPAAYFEIPVELVVRGSTAPPGAH